MYRLTLDLRAQSSSYHWGSTFHGMLISVLPPEMAEGFHGEGRQPFSQWLEPLDHERLRWHLQTLTDEAGEALAETLAAAPVLYSSRMRMEFPVLHTQCEHQDLETVLSDCLQREQVPKGLRLDVKTPVSHKSDGRYVHFPVIPLMLQGIRRRVLQVWPDFILGEEEAMEAVVSAVQLGRYRLQSAVFGIGGAYALGYTGQMDLNLIGGDDANRLAWFLLEISEWCGIGIKTALGMGGVTVTRLTGGRKG